MTDSKILQRARHGDPMAIATLLNQTLIPKGIYAVVTRHHTLLMITLEGDPIPSQHALIPWLVKGLKKLSVKTIQQVYISCKQPKSLSLEWKTVLQMTPARECISPNLHRATSQEGGLEQVVILEEVISNAVLTNAVIPDTGISDTEISDSKKEMTDSRNASFHDLPNGSSKSSFAFKNNQQTSPSKTDDHEHAVSPIYLKPGLSFYSGWIVATIVGGVIARAFLISSLAIPVAYTSTERSLIWLLAALIPNLIIGAFQGVVLGLEIPKSWQWAIASLLGSVVAGRCIRFIVGPYAPNLRSDYLILSILAATIPILVAQWFVIRPYVRSMIHWILVPTMGCLVATLLLQASATVGQFNLDWPTIISLIRIVQGVTSGGLIVQLLRDSCASNLIVNQATTQEQRDEIKMWRSHIQKSITVQNIVVTIAGSLFAWVFISLLPIPFRIVTLSLGMSVLPWLFFRALMPAIAHHMLLIIGSVIVSSLSFTLMLMVISFIYHQIFIQFAMSLGVNFFHLLQQLGIGLSAGSIEIIMVQLVFIWLGTVILQCLILQRKGFRPQWWGLSQFGLLIVSVYYATQFNPLSEEFILHAALLNGAGYVLALLTSMATVVGILGYPCEENKVSPFHSHA